MLGMIEEIIGEFADELGGPSNDIRWEYISATFGWLSGASLLCYLIFSIVRLPDASHYAEGLFVLSYGVAFKRDLKKITHSVVQANLPLFLRLRNTIKK